MSLESIGMPRAFDLRLNPLGGGYRGDCGPKKDATRTQEHPNSHLSPKSGFPSGWKFCDNFHLRKIR
jgi:hypothetical protein